MSLNTQGTNRDQLEMVTINDREKLIKQQVLVADPRRWRPRWFDGRFLAASDLQAEQNYFLIRQADLGRAGGSGVVEGLAVSRAGNKLHIEPGQGITDTGELVALFEAIEVNPADVPEMQRLDAAFGLQIIPNEPGRTRTGLYILALRPVEWTSNPIGAYPTSLTGTRMVEDSTIVEAVAVSLIPYPDESNDETWDRRRARVAREIFVEGRDHGLTSGALPLAMVALRGNIIDWIDPFMVRRETGAERPAGMDFGFGARALREAHLLQYQRHLADALNANEDKPFPANSYMDVLPPVGQFPSATINVDRLTQHFFPAGIDVELSFVPEDEMPAVIEESLLLPPIDLKADLKVLDATGVVVLVSLSRENFAAKRSELPNWDDELPKIRPAFLDIKARATPRELLLSRTLRPVATAIPSSEEEPWRKLLRDALNQKLLWYVRRRNLPTPANLEGTPVGADHAAATSPKEFVELLREDNALAEKLNKLQKLKTPTINILTRRLTESRFVKNPALSRTILKKAVGIEEKTLKAEDAVTALAPLADPALGDGLTRVEAENGNLGRTLRSDRLTESGTLVEIDKLAREVTPAKFSEFVEELRVSVRPNENIAGNLIRLRRNYGRTP